MPDELKPLAERVLASPVPNALVCVSEDHEPFTVVCPTCVRRTLAAHRAGPSQAQILAMISKYILKWDDRFANGDDIGDELEHCFRALGLLTEDGR